MTVTNQQYYTFIRFFCILTTFLLGLAAITGSSDDSSSNDYETINASLTFDTIAVSYDGTQPITQACTDLTTISAEAREALPDESRDIRIISWAMEALDIMDEHNIAFALSRASRSVQDLLRQYGLIERITESGLHATNRHAIADFKKG